MAKSARPVSFRAKWRIRWFDHEGTRQVETDRRQRLGQPGCVAILKLTASAVLETYAERRPNSGAGGVEATDVRARTTTHIVDGGSAPNGEPS